MAKRYQGSRAGFSLVELLIAVLFIGILMAGMANVFKSSINTFTTSSEGISSSRRNRMAFDLLYDDLNTAGLYITDLTAAPLGIDKSNPVFYILPNMPILNTAADDPQLADELFFYVDQPLPFEGTLTGTGAGGVTARSAATLAMQGVAPTVADNTYTVDCGDASYATQVYNLVQSGSPVSVAIKDSWDVMSIDQISSHTGTSLTFHVAANPTSGMTGLGASGAPAKVAHIINAGVGAGVGVVFFQPAQMVHYYVMMKLFDPQRPAGVPCLMRDQTTYRSTGWAGIPPAAINSSIVAENVSGFKIYLSANSGTGWVGLGAAYAGTDFDHGWTNGMRAGLDAQLVHAGRPGFTTTLNKENWIRDIPVLVRFDISTRTATKRAEYSATPLATTDFKNFTQSLVIVPRHFGLTMN